ncbi:MAG: MOSC domain-containing protein [Candidatus Saccharibacteria bacterium]|nr:MOSC domain-containing protein [Moraxellaceae bacterium]
MSQALHIASLHHYPLKSAQGISLTQAQMNPQGLELDRRWVLIGDTGNFLSQRTCAAMGAIHVMAYQQELTITLHGQTYIAIANPEHLIAPTVWGDIVNDCFAVQPEINTWLSHELGISVRLVYCPDNAIRRVDEHYAGQGHRTAFSDGFPLLVISQSSLDELARLWGAPIDYRRFRPNLIVGGACEPFAEDSWRSIRIDNAVFDLVKPCSRCVIPSLDPDTQQQTDGFLRFLAQHRRKDDGKVYLGQNAVLRRDTATFSLMNADRGLINDIGSHTQSLAENLGLLHTKKEHEKNAPDFEHFIQPILTVGQAIWVE